MVEKYLDLPNVSRISDITGTGKLPPIVTSLSFLKSTTIIHFFLPEASAFLGTTKIGEFHGLVLGTMMPSHNICCLFLNFFAANFRNSLRLGIYSPCWVYC
jgi:hypothetical protein